MILKDTKKTLFNENLPANRFDGVIFERILVENVRLCQSLLQSRNLGFETVCSNIISTTLQLKLLEIQV